MWQFVPAEVRRSECLVLLRRHRVEYLEAVAARDAAVIARFERHPTTLKQRESSRKLSALTREMSSRKVTAAAAKEGYESVLAVLDSLAAPPGLEKSSSSGGGGPPKGWERERRVSIDALAEGQDQVPKPHARVLAAPDALAKLIHAARARCKMDGTWEMRRVD